MAMITRRWVGLIPLLVLALITTSGCVQRTMVITSEPSGANIEINQTWRGKTPYTLRYKHGGTYDIRITKADYYPLRVAEPVLERWHQRPIIDITTDVLYPGTIKDHREFHYVLEKIGEEDNTAGIIARSREMKERVGLLASRRAEKDKNKHVVPLPIVKTKKEVRSEQKKKRKAREAEKKTNGKSQPPATDATPSLTPPPVLAPPKDDETDDQPIFQSR